MICSLCRGAGSLVSMQNGRLEWWGCPACGGVGTRSLFTAASIAIGRAQAKFMRPEPHTSADGR